MKSAPISDLQRRYAAIAQDVRESKEPVYLTRHGRADLVLVDAEEYAKRDQVYEQQRAVFQHEMKLKEKIEQGFAEIEAGNYFTLEEVEQQLAEKWSWDSLDALPEVMEG